MNKNWSNAVLVAYSHLPKFVKDIDLGVKNRVLSSFQSKHLKNGVTTEQLISEIMLLNDEKRKIVNLRFIVSEALDKMDETSKRMLIARVVKQRTFQRIADDFGVSLRTAFRRIEIAEGEYKLQLEKNGFSEQWFEKEYGNDKYVAPFHSRLVKEKYSVAKNL